VAEALHQLLHEVGMSDIAEVRFNRAQAEAARCAAYAAGWKGTLLRSEDTIARLDTIIEVRLQTRPVSFEWTRF
jgi:hypothetical protein